MEKYHEYLEELLKECLPFVDEFKEESFEYMDLYNKIKEVLDND